MISLYRTLYAPFPLAVLMSGLTLGLASNLMTDVFRNHPLDWPRLVSSGLYFLAALAFTILHSDFAKVDSNSRALINSGGGIPDGDGLVADMLLKCRIKLLLALCLGILAFGTGVGVSSGLIPLATPKPMADHVSVPPQTAVKEAPPKHTPRKEIRPGSANGEAKGS